MGLMSTKEETSSSADNSIVASIPCQYCYFRPQIFFQKVESWHMADAQLEFKMNFTTGENHARFSSGVNTDSRDDELMEQMMRNACKIVPQAEGKDDTQTVSSKLIAAVTWGDHDMLEYLLRSCYVTESCALPALYESCSRGYVRCIETLIAAGVNPVRLDGGGKSALHIACENGQEESAVVLIDAMRRMNDVNTTYGGATAFDFLRNNDMCGMARRLEAYALDKFQED
jgi:hypothetical protein